MADLAFEDFAGGYEAGRAQIVFRRVVADLETPVGAYLKLSEGRLADSPALNAIDHPVYDIWLVDCKQSSDTPPPDASTAAPSSGVPQ